MKGRIFAFAVVTLLGCASPRERPVAGTPTDSAREAPVADERGSATAPAFSTYDEATEYVRATYDGESIDTSRSSWITGAEYFEAGGRGYLILGMRGKDYIFEGVPPDVWEGFKEAPSLGTYYHEAIRGRYHFDLDGSDDATDGDQSDDDDSGEEEDGADSN